MLQLQYLEPKPNIRWISIEEAKEMYPPKELDEDDSRKVKTGT